MSSQKVESSQPALDDTMFSTSVRDDLRRKVDTVYGGRAHLLQLCTELHGIHPEYAEGSFVPFLDFLTKNGPPSAPYPVKGFDEWLRLAQEFVNRPLQTRAEVINGRIFLCALILSEYPKLRTVFHEIAAWRETCKKLVQKLADEMRKRNDIEFESLLTPEGKKRRAELWSTEGDLDDLYNRDDMPTDTDLLSRDALAEYLARRIRHVYKKSLTNAGQKSSFFIHVEGEWGAGKTTFLRFLKKHLKKKAEAKDAADKESDEWIVAEFNAWRNQRLNPPWWYIIKAVYSEALHTLRERKHPKAFRFWLSEQGWRLNTGRNFFAAAFITMILFVCALAMGIRSEKSLKESSVFTTIAGLVSLGGFLWSLSGWLRTSLISGSGKSAREFIQQSGKDPMKVLNEHYEKMIGRMGYPLAVFIDDLDRCNQEYGIQLLEGLQTIFKDAPVVYVIAADGKWLSTMYEKSYADFSAAVAQPGKSFGMMFMDKTFQLKVELPEVSASLKEQYWNSLLGLAKSGVGKKLEDAEATAEAQLKELSDNKERLASALSEKDPLVAQKKKEKALSKMEIAEEDKFFESRLQRYLSIIDNNPRSMKRLINTLSIERALMLIGNNVAVTDEELILWTILKMQYPLVGDYLWKYPAAVGYPEELPGNPSDAFSDLFRDSAVRNLLAFTVDGKQVRISTEFLKKIKGG